MKIVQMVCSQLPPGGYEHAVHNLSNALVRRNHDVVLLARRTLPWLGPSITDLEPTSYRVARYFLPPLKGSLHASFGKHAIRRLLANFEADIIHCTMGWPCPVWCMDAFPTVHPGLIAHFQGADVQTNPEYGYGMRLIPRRDREIRRVAAECPNLIAVSNAMKNELVSIGADDDRVKILHNGVDTRPFNTPAPPTPLDTPYLFSMGRLVRKKGYDLLLDAFSHIAALHSNIHLCIAGNGPERDALIAATHRLGLVDRVHFLGFVTGDEKTAWFMNAKAYVHPARREPCALAIAEALAAGLPVVAFAVDGNTDTISDGKNGFLVPPYDAEAFADRTARLVEDDALCAQCATDARQSGQLYDWEAITDQLLDYYRQITNRRRAVRPAETT